MSHAPYEPVPQAPPHWAQQPVQPGGSSRLLPVLGVVLGSLGLIAGVGAWLRPAPSGAGAAPVYSEQQVADAKKAVCEDYGQGMRAMRAAGTRKPDNPADPFPATAVNIRLAEVAVGNSFFNTVRANPAAPSELADLVDRLGKLYQNIALVQLADGQKPDFQSLAAEADEIVPKIDAICQ